MKTSTYFKASIVLASLLMISACGGKSREGGDGTGGPGAQGGAGTPIQPQFVASDFYDNAGGQMPLTSIKGEAIRNVTLSLIDASGTTSGFTSRTVLNFDGEGLLTSISAIDVAAFSARNQAQGGLDPWSQYNNNVQSTQQIVNFTARNISYNFNRVTGEIRIDNYTAGSSVVSPTTAQVNPNIGSSQGRMGIFVSGATYKRKTGRFLNLSSMVTRPSIVGRLANLSSGEMLDANSMAGFNPQTSGFDLSGNVAITYGSLTPSPMMTTNYVNGSFQTVQTTRELFIRDYLSNSFVYIDPILSPRVQ